MTEDLYNVKDTKRVRELLTLEQNNLCAITGLPIEDKQHILEHVHDNEMFVRGVASRQANSALGVIEKMWIRYLRWWYPHDLPTFLDQCSKYLRRKQDKRYRHPSFLKRLAIDFNKLSSKQQDQVLITLGSQAGKNSKERKELFSKIVLDRTLGYVIIKDVINQTKGE